MNIDAIHGTTDAAAVVVQRPEHSITDAELSIIETVLRAAPGSWFAVDEVCECCGNITVAIGPTSDAVLGPWFELVRNEDKRLELTTTWPNGANYTSEFWSLDAALRSVMITIMEGMGIMQPFK
jgi:hypothetical protein